MEAGEATALAKAADSKPMPIRESIPLYLEVEEPSTSGRHEEEAGPSQRKRSSWRDWPPQIRYIIGNEICERFSFYGMRAILVVHMTDNLLMSVPNAESAFHLFTAACYMLPLFGAWLADNVLGKYRVVLYLSGFYCLGHGVLALWESETGLAMGLALISLGAGGIKPCVAAMVGDQFENSSKYHLPAVFSLFYWCINVGSFAAIATIPLVLKYFGPRVAFIIPGIFMAASLAVFWSGRKLYVLVEPAKGTDRPAGFVRVFTYCLQHTADRRPGEGFWAPAAGVFTAEEIDAAGAVAGLLGLFGCMCMFQALFDQHSSTWVVQAQKMDLSIFDWEMPASEMQVLNPVLVMVLIPLFETFVYPAVSKITKLELTPLRKMSSGMMLAGVSFLYVACIQTPAYFILTSSEVLVSTTGLQFAYTQAPLSIKSTIMSLYLLTVAGGNLLDALVTKINMLGDLALLLFFAALMFLVGLVFVWVAVGYRMRDYGPADTDKAKSSDAGDEGAEGGVVLDDTRSLLGGRGWIARPELVAAEGALGASEAAGLVVADKRPP